MSSVTVPGGHGRAVRVNAGDTIGYVITATNIMTPVDADSFLWQSVERTVDGESLPDLVPVAVTRVKGKR